MEDNCCGFGGAGRGLCDGVTVKFYGRARFLDERYDSSLMRCSQCGQLYFQRRGVSAGSAYITQIPVTGVALSDMLAYMKYAQLLFYAQDNPSVTVNLPAGAVNTEYGRYAPQVGCMGRVS